MKCEAMVLTEFKKPLVRDLFEIPRLGPGEVLVRMEAAGVCGSDVHMWQGRDPRVALPIILGHEGIGRIEAIGAAARSVHGEPLKEGDRILWDRGVTCKKCYYCTVTKQHALCSNRRVYGINRSCAQRPYLNGCYSEYVILINGTNIFKVEENIDPAVLVTACCSGATMCNAFDQARPAVGDTVVVQGVGPLGIFAAAMARLSGAAKVIAIGGTRRRLEICRELGADVTINRNDTTQEERRQLIMDMTYGRGADFVIEAVGLREALSEGLDLVRRGGTYLIAGFGQPMGEIAFDGYRHLVVKNLKIQGVWVSDTTHTWQAMNMIMKDSAAFGKIITHRFPLSHANDALEVMHQKQAVKSVLTFI